MPPLAEVSGGAGRLGASIGARRTLVALRDAALLGVPVVAVGVLVTAGPQAWALAAVALAAILLALVTAGSGERSALGRALFLSAAVAVPFAILNGIRPIGALTLGDVAFVAAVVLAGLAILLEPGPRWKVPLPGWLIGAAAGLFAAGLLVELIPTHVSGLTGFTESFSALDREGLKLTNISGVIRLTVTLLLVPLVIMVAADSQRRVYILVELWIAAVLVGGVVGCLDYLGLSLGESLAGDEYGFGVREAGLATHPTTFALSCAMTLPLIIGRLGGAHGKRRFYYLAAILILVAAIGVSGSRSGVFAAVLGSALVILLSRNARRSAALLAIGLVLAIVVGAIAGLGNLPSVERFTAEGGLLDQSTEARLTIAESVWPTIEERPIVGQGFQNLRGNHNIYLQLLQAGGLVALLSFALFAGGALWLGLRCGRDRELSSDMRDLAHALTASIAAWLLAALALTQLLDRFVYVPVGLLLAIAALRARAQHATSSTIDAVGTSSP